jgi:hypothetical protein
MAKVVFEITAVDCDNHVDNTVCFHHKDNWLTLFLEVTAVYCDNHVKRVHCVTVQSFFMLQFVAHEAAV